MQRQYFAEHLWTPSGWSAGQHLDVGADGSIARVSATAHAGTAQILGRFVVPGMPNIHSHAFQRAMAGLAERQTDAQDSFWTWREVMYGFAARIGPEALRDIAAQLYVEMLRAGYTSVCEFHYLHHAPDGAPYDDPATMSLALIEAAREAGIGLTLLPVLYMRGGFDGRALSARQQRFGFAVDGFLRLLERLRGLQDAQLRVGLAFHSLRAVPEQAMREVLAALPAFGGDLPVHIHIAEQVAEVEDCMAAHGARPVQWLLQEMPVDARWTLVHATHLDAAECSGIARSGATVALCPTTEANLGDGLFPLGDYLQARGRWGIGSDSHISVSPVEELRWLEYGQRLRTQRRNIALASGTSSVGESLFAGALAGGARASGHPLGGTAAAASEVQATDLLVLDHDAPELAARSADQVLDSWLFSGNRNLVRDVFVGGRQVVAGGRHVDQERIAMRYRRTVEALA